MAKSSLEVPGCLCGLRQESSNHLGVRHLNLGRDIQPQRLKAKSSELNPIKGSFAELFQQTREKFFISSLEKTYFQADVEDRWTKLPSESSLSLLFLHSNIYQKSHVLKE